MNYLNGNMKNFIYEIMLEPFIERDAVTCVFSFVLWVIVIIASVAILYGVFYVADSSFRPEYETIGTIQAKRYIPEHTTTTYTTINNVMVPVTTRHPDDFIVSISTDHGTDSVSVSRSYYISASTGDRVLVKYCKGRFSGDFYINSIVR